MSTTIRPAPSAVSHCRPMATRIRTSADVDGSGPGTASRPWHGIVR